MNNPNNLPFKTLDQLNVANKKVLLRADLNVPLKNGVIIDDYRLKALIPTITKIQKNGGRLILATHLGRPQDNEPELSTKNLMPWFEQHALNIHYASTFADAKKLRETASQNTLILLENLRFFPGEKNQDPLFAQQLADLADYYVNDAFALLHRNDTSITLVPERFDHDHKAVGPLILQELHALRKLIDNSQRPFVLIIGGGKVETKLPLINNLFDHVDIVLLCPAVVNTFLYAQGKSVGKSLVVHELLATAKEIIQRAEQKNVSLQFPYDYQVALDTLQGPLTTVNADNFPKEGLSISIGPKTIAAWQSSIATAHTIFFNGAMGFTNRPETLTGLNELLKVIAQSSAYTVVGGGDSVAAVNNLGIANKIKYLSTGGGATIAYLSGEQLPGLMFMV